MCNAQLSDSPYLQIKYEYDVYVSRHCHDILAPYFENLFLPIAEEALCGFEKEYHTYSLEAQGVLPLLCCLCTLPAMCM